MVGSLVSKMWDKELRAADLRNEGNRCACNRVFTCVSYSKIVDAVRESRSYSDPSPSTFELGFVLSRSLPSVKLQTAEEF